LLLFLCFSAAIQLAVPAAALLLLPLLQADARTNESELHGGTMHGWRSVEEALQFFFDFGAFFLREENI